MSTPAVRALCVVSLIVVVVSVDLAFFRHGAWFWERLAANVGIVTRLRGVLLQVPRQVVGAGARRSTGGVAALV